MSVLSRTENEEDVQIIKEYTLLPILLDMLTRDMEELKIYKDKIVYNQVYLNVSIVAIIQVSKPKAASLQMERWCFFVSMNGSHYSPVIYVYQQIKAAVEGQ